MTNTRKIGRLLSLVAAVLLTLALHGVFQKGAVSASAEAFERAATSSADAGWIWSEVGSRGYAWAKPDRFAVALPGSAETTYSWALANPTR